MPVVQRLGRLIWGDQLDAAVRPLVAQGFASSLAASAGWSFLGIWAIRQLHAGQTALGLAFTVGAVLGALTGYAAGHASDYVGRKPLMLASSGGFVVLVLCLLLVGRNQTFGLVLLGAAPPGPRVRLGGAKAADARELGRLRRPCTLPAPRRPEPDVRPCPARRRAGRRRHRRLVRARADRRSRPAGAASGRVCVPARRVEPRRDKRPAGRRRAARPCR